MEATVIIALILAIVVCILPGVMAWYFNFGGMMHALRKKRALRQQKTEAKVGKTS